MIENKLTTTKLLTFIAITLFNFFETAQMGYFNVLAPSFLKLGIYNHAQIASLSAAYFYGCVLGLLPVGFTLDKLSLRKALLWAIFGSVIGAFLLPLCQSFFFQWDARFICGFFGGAFSFVGGLRLIALLFPNRMTLFIGLFISAGMLGGLICQYPLLIAVKHFGTAAAMTIVAVFGLLMMLFNLLYLKPFESHKKTPETEHYAYSFWQSLFLIATNYRNWLDCLMVIFLDLPVCLIGTLWGLVILMSCYHLSDVTSTWLVMIFFLGLIIGSPAWGMIADRNDHSEWLIVFGSSASFIMIMFMLFLHTMNVVLIACLLFGLGLFSSCQTLGFTWLTKNMRNELIGRNSAFNSMLLMTANGGFKQLGAYFLTIPPLAGQFSAVNLLILMSVCMVITTIYACFRKLLNRQSADTKKSFDKFCAES